MGLVSLLTQFRGQSFFCALKNPLVKRTWRVSPQWIVTHICDRAASCLRREFEGKMKKDQPFRSPTHQTRYEVFEERIVLSAQPLQTFWLDPFEADSLEAPYHEVAPTLQTWDSVSSYSTIRDLYGFDGSGQTVAVIDTGIAYDHVALGGGYGDGFRVVGGWDFAENDADPYDDGPGGFHGTHVAGIVGSDDDLYSGVASGVDLVALRVFDDQGYGSFAWVEQALQWVHDHKDDYANPITTVNLSLGTDWNSDNVPQWAMLEDEFQLLNEDGIFVSVAAGNSFQSYQSPGLSYPASSPFVIPVASHGSDGDLSYFSQRNDRVLVAPGEQIVSTVPGYLFGNASNNEGFMAASGTSMAAPYVAGASTLVREAMDFVGYQDVDSDLINDHFRATADIIYDAVTQANYHKLNLERALDSLMADDYGDLPESAFQLGEWADTHQWSGIINRLDDVDCFSIVAGHTGLLELTTTASEGLEIQWMVDQQVVQPLDGRILLEVQEGQSYQLSVSSLSGLGRYDVAGTLTPVEAPAALVDLGLVDAASVESLALDGTLWVRAEASHSGIMTWQTLPSSSGSLNALQVFDAYGNPLGSTTGSRLDVEVEADATYLLRIDGDMEQLGLKVTNLVQREGQELRLYGTSGDDRFEIAMKRGFHINVAGTQYYFRSREVGHISIDGGSGQDEMAWFGARSDELIQYVAGNCSIQSNKWSLEANHVEDVKLASGGGYDRVFINDSAGDDHLELTHRSVRFSNADHLFSVDQIRRVTAYSHSGHDTVEMVGSRHDDKIVVHGSAVSIANKSFRHHTSGFDQVTINAAQGGRDKLQIYDTFLDDDIQLGRGLAQVTSSEYDVTIYGVAKVKAYSVSGGDDSLTFHDTVGKDRFVGRSDAAVMKGYGYALKGFGFSEVVANSSGQNLDRAFLYDSSGDDLFTTGPYYGRMEGDNFSTEAIGFQNIYAVSNRSGAVQAAYHFAANQDPTSVEQDSFLMGIASVASLIKSGPWSADPMVVTSTHDAFSHDAFSRDAFSHDAVAQEAASWCSQVELDSNGVATDSSPSDSSSEPRTSNEGWLRETAHQRVFADVDQAHRLQVEAGFSDATNGRLRNAESDGKRATEDFLWGWASLEELESCSVDQVFNDFGRRYPR